MSHFGLLKTLFLQFYAYFLQIIAFKSIDFHTNSLLIRDVELRLHKRFELVLLTACVDPSILHDLLKQTHTGLCERRCWIMNMHDYAGNHIHV